MASLRPPTISPEADSRYQRAPLISRGGLRSLDRDSLPGLLLLAFGPLVYAAWLGTVAAMLVLACALLLLTRRDGPTTIAKGVRTFAFFFGPLIAWMVATAAWSLNGEASVELALRLAGVFAAGTLLVVSVGRLPFELLRRPLIAAALGLSGAALVVVADLETGGHLARFLHAPRLDGYDPSIAYERGATLHAILLVPIAAGLQRIGRPRVAICFTVLGVAAILATSSLSAKMALAAALATFALVFLLPRLRWGGLAFLACAAAALPLLFPITLKTADRCWLADHKPSALHRLDIWGFAAAHIRERPIVGWGLGASRILPGGKAPVVIHLCDAALHPDGIALKSQILPLHPHDAILQVWLELGGIGVVLAFGPLLLSIRRMFRNPGWGGRRAQAVLAATTAAAVSVGLVSYGIWQEWYLSGLFVAAAFVVLAARQTAAAEGGQSVGEPARLG